MSDAQRQIESPGDNAAPQAQLSALPAPARTPAPTNGTRAVSVSGRRNPIPHRNPTVRRRVRELEETLGYEPTQGDRYALVRWAHTYEKWRSIGERLDRDGDTRQDGEPKKLLAEWRALSDTLSRLERDLGLTATARASLGVDIGRMRKLGQDDNGADDGDVVDMEQRIVKRLQGEGDDAG